MHVGQCDEANALCKTCAAESLRGSHDLLLLTSRGKGEAEGKAARREIEGTALETTAWVSTQRKSCSLQSGLLD